MGGRTEEIRKVGAGDEGTDATQKRANIPATRTHILRGVWQPHASEKQWSGQQAQTSLQTILHCQK